MGVTNMGKSGLAMILAGYGSGPTHVAIGSGVTAYAETQTGLVAEVDRNAITGSADTSTLRKVSYTANWSVIDVTGGEPISEIGVFNPGSDMFSREKFNAVNKDDTLELEVEYIFEIF